MHTEERMFVAIDVANLWKSCKEAFGPNSRVDFKVLRGLLTTPEPEVAAVTTAYIVTNPKQNHHSFVKSLHHLGYAVKERFLRHEKGLTKPMHTDWDVGITIDALDQLDNYDTFGLVSGDGDFGLLLDYLKAKGKTTVVMSFANTTSKLLYEAADRLHVFGKEIVYTQQGAADGHNP